MSTTTLPAGATTAQPLPPPDTTNAATDEQNAEHPAQPSVGRSQIDLAQEATAVLTANDRGTHTIPAQGLYPHQWLWDSCFVAIGLRHIDPQRACRELVSLCAGQWANGMLPNMIFDGAPQYERDRNFWRSWISPYSPDTVATSGITQPPMLAEAVWQVGQKLATSERRSWYRRMLPHIINYHTWLYKERDPHDEGLVILVHPWETGLDSTPPWMTELHDHLLPGWIRFIERAHLEGIISFFRRDRHYIPPGQRLTTIETLAMFAAQRRLRRKRYDSFAILDHSLFSIEDLTYNCILARANQRLTEIAAYVHATLPDDLTNQISLTPTALEKLWDEATKQYYSRDFITHRLLMQPTIATLMPLYAGTITPERAAQLVRLLENDRKFGPAFPVPSVPLDSQQFEPQRYWQGPSWVNMNWLIIDGLRRYGFTDHAAALTETTLEMVRMSGMAEYFDPLTAEPLGAHNFSWTAALTLDLLRQTP
jgi:hypothetical protein